MAVSVVGFDIGYQSCYISVARQGGIETVDNEYSDRRTEVCISYGEKNRFIGHSAKQQMLSNLKNTLTGFTRLIGKKFEDATVQMEIPYLPYKIIEIDNHRIGIEVQYLNETVIVTPEQAVASQMTKLKETAEANLNTKVVDCVVNVPTYYTDAERRAMLDAAHIAGLNCTRLLNDTTAAGIAYGIYNKDLPEPDQPSRNVILVDMGHSSLQVAVVAFNKGKMRVLATSCDPFLGGRDFDRVIFNQMAKEFAQHYKLDVNDSAKASLRLMDQCEKLKKLMSANSQDLPLNIECFMNDVDVTGHLKRELFEELSASLLSRVEACFANALKESKLTVDDIFSVEIIGGSTRLPSVKALVTKVFGKEARTTLNADEAVARGCALQCAIFSPAFRVKDFSITDACPYSISLHYQETNGMDTTEVFPLWHAFPFSRQLTFFRKEPFILEAKYTNSDAVPNNNKVIGNFKIGNVVPTPEGESSKVKLKVRVNIHGIFTISQAQLVERVEKEIEPEPVPAPSAAGEKKEAAEPTVNGAAPSPNAPSEPMDTDSSAESKAAPEGTEKEPTEDGVQNGPAKSEGEKKTKMVNRYIDLPMQMMILQYGKDKLNDFAELESKMIMQDKLEKERSMAKNAVEEYVYEMRDKMYGSLESFVTDNERDVYLVQLSSTEEWLYDEGEDMQKQVYLDRLAAMKKDGDRFVTRAKEAQERPKAIDEFGRLCVSIQKALESYESGEEIYAHIDSAEMAKVRLNMDEKRKWFEHEMNMQNAKKKNEDPVLTASRIRVQKQSLESVVNPILNKPKPTPKPAEPPANGDHKADTNQNAAPDAQANQASENPQSGTTTDKAEDMDLD